MARVLILSSFVAASRVGGGAQALALARLGIEPILAPTVLYGRHPGHGAPGGAAVSPETLASVLTGIEAQGTFAALDAVITGYFATPEQVAVAVDRLQRIKAAAPAAQIVVDPIMGDDGAPYVREAVAEAISLHVVPRADLVCPNTWELAHLTGVAVNDPATAMTAARALGRPTLVSSIPCDADIGVLYVDARWGAWIARHGRSPVAPRGTGDLLTAYFTAALVHRRAAPQDALSLAVSVVADIVAGAVGKDPLVPTLPFRLAPSRRVQVEAVGD
jgi:pyridoxine kinase